MRKQPLLISSIVIGAVCGIFSYASASKDTATKEQRRRAALEESLRNLPETELQAVEMEDLLEDSVYIKLASEGWSAREITRIMKTAIADKEKARQKDGYVHYAKEIVPSFRRMIGGDTLASFMDTVFTRQMRESIERTVPEDLLNAYWPPKQPYTPPRERANGTTDCKRDPGYFSEVKFRPSCGRTYWSTLHPTDPNKLYVIPDGCGIFKTDDMGKHWDCITDRIPNRADRSQCGGTSLPVDPDDWNHLFAFMANSSVWETCDGGQTWRKIQGATHKSFKHGECFRDKSGKLKFIGALGKSWTSTLWISEDTCKTWTAVQIPDEMKDRRGNTGQLGAWFQYIVFDPSDRDKIYLPTARSIFYFDDGAKSTLVNGQRTYNIKKLSFEVYDETHTIRRYANHPNDMGADPDNNTIFPCPGVNQGDMIIDPNNPDKMWYVTATNIGLNGNGNNSAVYYSEDHGKTWITIQDLAFGIGSGNAFGSEIPGNWLGGFGVNFKDPSKVYGCTMNSAKSFDGGKTFTPFAWTNVINYQEEDGRWIGVSASRHNADNHSIRSHKDGFVFRGSDGGMLMIHPDYNNGEWTNISGDMGAMLFYSIAVNEFGDQVMAGNTQDLDGQTWRYGRWGRWRGYEGCEAFINPYTSTVYLPNCGWQGWDPTHMGMDSWRNAKTKADVVSGSWYMSRSGVTGKSFLRVDDLGHTVVNLEEILGQGIGLQNKFGLCRDKGRTTVYAIGNNNYYYYSTDGGNSFQNVMFQGKPAAFSNTVIATDPNNSDIFYFGRQGQVHRYYNIPGEERWEEVCTGQENGAFQSPGLPNISCSQLLFHEGSGDLYFYNSGSAGIYILECLDKEKMKYAPEWRFWTKGYNSGKAGNVEINYTTQEMVIYDYGRGVWCADLEHPSDRYFDNGFALKELSFKDGRRTIGIDTEWTIPLYYYFKWTVNDEEIDNPYQYLRRRLNPGDRVQLELTLRESPDVKTLSSVFVVPEVATAPDNEDNASQGNVSFDIKVDKQPGHALHSNGKGRVDLGYFDYFFNDFTIDFWINPSSNGTILANRGHEGDAKGWELWLDNGQLKFEYAPRNIVVQPRYEASITQSRAVSTSAARLNFGAWSHVAITHERHGNVKMYINGILVATDPRIIPESTLNNSMILSLFADGIETRQIEATVDELKIWNYALGEDEVRREMHSTNTDDKDGLVAYWPFNSGILESDVETFSRHAPKSRVLAETTHPLMTVPTCARYVGYGLGNSAESSFADHDNTIFSFAAPASDEPAAATELGNFGVYAFDASQWQNEEDNLDTDFFDYHPIGYYIHKFDGAAANGKLDFDFYPVEGEFNPDKNYRVYASEYNTEKQVWEEVGKAAYNPETKSIHLTEASLADITDKKLLIITTKPSIELVIEGIDADGKVGIYDEAEAVFPMKAVLLDGFPEPTGMYNIESDGIFKPTGLYFADKKSFGELRFDMTKLGDFNTTIKGTLRSPDNAIVDSVTGKSRPSMIPRSIEVTNRIAPRRIGTGLKLYNGVATVGDANLFQSMKATTGVPQQFTIMGWVRVDSIKMLSGTYALMTFNGPNNGIRLINGGLGLTFNGSTPWIGGHTNGGAQYRYMGIQEEDIGQWMHIGVVKNGNQHTMYVNGAAIPFNVSNTFNSTGALNLGKNSGEGAANNNNDNFQGAFDQVAVWNRALSDEEFHKYMFSPVPLNDKGLLSYVNMDYFTEDDKARDIYSLGEIKISPTTALSGEVSFGEPSPLPFDARSTERCSESAPISLTYDRNGRTAWVSTFRGTPYCYLNHDFQNYTSLNQDFYGITFADRPQTTPAATDSITLTYRHRSIIGDEPLAVAMRRTGSLDHLAGFIHATSVEPGVATFRVPATYLHQPSEVMFFTYPDETGDGQTQRPAMLQMSFPLSVASRIDLDEEVPTLVLHDDETSIPVNADVMALSRNWDKDVRIVVDETLYATPSQETIDFSTTENKFMINLDLDKMDLYGVNDLTIGLEGATSNQLRLKLIFEPYVLLTLQNGQNNAIISPGIETTPDPTEDSESIAGNESRRRKNLRKRAVATAPTGSNTFRTSSPVANLEINAELLQGYLPEGEQVKLDVISELSHSMSIGGGNLLKNESVSIDGLEHHDSPKGAYHEGWNLIGNPYLTNINLTKEQNVEYDPESITKFLYQCDPVTGNYKVFDMTAYNAEQKIHPFQSYFVQTMTEDASFTVTPIAKEVSPSKRTRSTSYPVYDRGAITFGLSNADGSKDYDNVVIVYDESSDKNFVTNEDAPKLWNITGSAPEIYVMTTDKQNALAISTTSVDPDLKEYKETLSIGVKSDKEQKLRLEILKREGLVYKSLHIKDNKTGETWDLEDVDWINPAKNSTNVLAADAGDSDEVADETKYVYHEFTAYPGDDPNRFTLAIQNDIPTEIDTHRTNRYAVEVEEGACTISGLQGDATVRIYTPNGLNMINQHTELPSLTVYLEKGVFIVIINENGKEYTSKILVK